jgi:hypothetical protein
MTAELVPLETPIDQDEARQALVEAHGNVTEAAKAMSVRPERLRAFVHAVPKLAHVIDEVMEQGVDQAISVLHQALNDELSFQNRFYAAKEFLRSAHGRRRGFGGREPGQAVEVSTSTPGTFTLKWLEPPQDPE